MIVTRAAKAAAQASARQQHQQLALQRRSFIGPAYRLAKKVTPNISATEAAALEAGTVGFDRDIFAGEASLKHLKSQYSVPKLSPAEQSFMDKEVTQLCEMIDDYEIGIRRDLSKPVWDFIRQNKFLGMCIPTKYGGLGFTAHGHSQVVQKLSCRSGSAAVSVMVPNSLGPGELLMRYGTDAQKDYYLPRLARGELIPCFGLTAAASGSDAASMRDTGTVVRENGVLGVRANFKKRYITLAPIAGVVGLAFNLRDPSRLLGGVGAEGISVVLLERGHPGLRIGDRHDPLASAFMNGTVEGENVFIPLDQIIGGQARAGFGWNMLMDCLAEGRGVSLPAMSVAASKMVAGTVGAYARIRKQFKVPLAELEGVQEHLARVGANTLIAQSSQALINAMLNQHEQPAVLSAVMKQQLTTRMRTTVTDGMDVLGGAGICNGPANFLAAGYMSVPIAITVEGANTLTRSLIIFGQGLTRSHPHLLDIIRAIQAGNDQAGFNKALGAMVRHGVRNAAAATGRALLRKRALSGGEAYYESQLDRLTSAFAFCADVSLTMGGKIKFAEMLSGRYADVLSNLVLGYATLWYTSQHADVKGIDAVRDYAMQGLLAETEDAFYGIFDNFPTRPLAWAMRGMAFPTGRTYRRPSDDLAKEVSRLVSTDSAVRDLFVSHTFVSADPSDRVALIHATLPKAVRADEVLKTLRREKRDATPAEQALIDEVEAAREIIIQVDSFKGLGQERAAGFDQSARPALDDIYNTRSASKPKAQAA
ncbi:acyl-CoA dehydrogenase [Tribonema minus]|uniref:Acyl-coenzyme A dehydrogenase n=1 Tax=Tribonema minus TaxID=303371 RepID=A0A835YIS3_9STRA|nr:acyl-CoA dehydrogenase [Tribonema minus]